MAAKLVFIINPISGKRDKGAVRRQRVEAFLAKHALQAEVWETERAGHAPELALKAIENGATRVVCIGGDGTINEVGRVVVGTEVEFGLVPMGSGNGLARHMGIPLNFDKALRQAAVGVAVWVDTGEADGRPFFNVMGVGFDAEVGRRFNETKARGFISYLREGWSAYRSYRSVSYEIRSGGNSRRLQAYIVAVANSSQYGSNAFIAPDASMTDGKLNLVAIAEPTFVSMFVLIWRMFRKKLYLSPRVTPICAESFVLRLPGKSFFHVDGEVFACGEEMTIRTRPQSLRIVAVSC